MQKEVIVFLESVQRRGLDEEDKVEIVTVGDYYYKNGKHYLMYDEVSEDGREKTKNVVKVYEDGRAEVIKKGDAGIHMIFEEGQKNFSYYDMPYGKMMVALDTRRVDFKEEENKCVLRLEYRLEMNYQHMADCVVTVRAEAKENCTVDLGCS